MQPRFITIKSALLNEIENGALKPGDQVASENQLAERFEVSRMTARRAISELVSEGILARTQGVGTFVSDSRPMSSMLTIRGIQDEIASRGHTYSCEVLSQEKRPATPPVAKWMGVDAGTPLFYTCIVHYENTTPLQHEVRWVNPIWAPDYLNQDFTRVTANRYLNKVAPLTEADHVVEATLPSSDIADALQIDVHTPCLKINRRTFSARGIVSVATLMHPGNRYRLGDHLAFGNPSSGD